MRFLLDENMEFRVATALRAWGHDVTAIAYDYPHALEDLEVLSLARTERRILLTNDRDFGELIFRQQLPNRLSKPCYFCLQRCFVWIGRDFLSRSQFLPLHSEQPDLFVLLLHDPLEKPKLASQIHDAIFLMLDQLDKGGNFLSPALI